jgi:hypothetical protein
MLMLMLFLSSSRQAAEAHKPNLGDFLKRRDGYVKEWKEVLTLLSLSLVSSPV